MSCCRRNFDDRRVQVDCGEDFDWPLFLRLARFHRVQGLTWHALADFGLEVPEQVAGQLRDDARAIAAANLQSAVESRRLLAAFEDADVPLLFVKGLSLGVLAYSTIATKSGIDIDLLVEAEQLTPASALLRELGYRLAEPQGGATKLETWHRLRKESTWQNPDIGLQVDLHTRLADNPNVIPTIGITSPRQTVELAKGIALPTLARDELFAYLAVHGASSAWFRLKWIADFAALCYGWGAGELIGIYRRSQELRAGRASAQGLLLADRLFGLLEGAPALRQELERDGRSRWLSRAALKELTGSVEPVEPTMRFFGTARIHYTQLLMLPGAAFKVSEFVRQARAALLAAAASAPEEIRP